MFGQPVELIRGLRCQLSPPGDLTGAYGEKVVQGSSFRLLQALCPYEKSANNRFVLKPFTDIPQPQRAIIKRTSGRAPAGKMVVEGGDDTALLSQRR